MILVKLPDGIRKNQYIYVNPDNVTYLYEKTDGTYIVTNDTGSDDYGYCVPLPLDEVAERLQYGNKMYELTQALKEKEKLPKLLDSDFDNIEEATEQ